MLVGSELQIAQYTEQFQVHKKNKLQRSSWNERDAVIEFNWNTDLKEICKQGIHGVARYIVRKFGLHGTPINKIHGMVAGIVGFLKSRKVEQPLRCYLDYLDQLPPDLNGSRIHVSWRQIVSRSLVLEFLVRSGRLQ